MQEKCTTYIRYADEKCPFYIQRSLAKTVLHIQRKSNLAEPPGDLMGLQ
jgi:hypothetical protein